MDESGTIAVDAVGLAELAVAVWRIDRRSRRDHATPESVRIACESALDKIRALGVELKDNVGDMYDEGSKARVVERIPAPGGAKVKECLSPGVYFENRLILQAEIVVEGESNHG